MRCIRCKSKDRIVNVNGLFYCRDCIMFKRIVVGKPLKTIEYEHSSDNAKYRLDYQLSKDQNQISKQVLNNYKLGKNVIIQAVCGSGKTELVYDSIQYALNRRQRVCFALPRRELAIEIFERLNQQFEKVRIVNVYGGYTDDLFGDLVVCTTHQLYRYHQVFDLLIIDEVDAFPFYGNSVLKQIAYQSVKGSIIFLSATLCSKDIDLDGTFITLFRRYHGSDLPVPKIRLLPEVLMLIDCMFRIRKFRKQKKLVLVFVPTIEKTKIIEKKLKYLGLACISIHSKTIDKNKQLMDFKSHQYDALITTTLLERGVTFSNCQVIVLYASHQVFNSATLIQIAGRVGRKIDFPNGDVYFYDKVKSKAMKTCVQEIKKMNIV